MARILIVEDEPLIAMMVEEWLVELGHEPVGPVTTVELALQAVEHAEFDGAILDVNLHGERCERVADALLSRGKPFALSTGECAGTRGNYGACITLSKPYDYDDLGRVVGALIEQARSQPVGSVIAAVERQRVDRATDDLSG